MDLTPVQTSAPETILPTWAARSPSTRSVRAFCSDRVPQHARRTADLARRLVHLGIDSATVEGGYMPERSVAVRSEGMQCVRRYHDYIACCRDDVNAVDAIDTAPLRHDEHLAPGVAMLRRVTTGRIVTDRDRDSPDTVVVSVNESNRSTRRVFKGTDIRRLDWRLRRLDHAEPPPSRGVSARTYCPDRRRGNSAKRRVLACCATPRGSADRQIGRARVRRLAVC